MWHKEAETEYIKEIQAVCKGWYIETVRGKMDILYSHKAYVLWRVHRVNIVNSDSDKAVGLKQKAR